MDGEDPVEDRIDGLTVNESVSDEAIISRGSRGVQPQIRDCGAGMSGGTEGVNSVGVRTFCGYIEPCLCGDLLEPRDARHWGRRRQKVERKETL